MPFACTFPQRARAVIRLSWVKWIGLHNWSSCLWSMDTSRWRHAINMCIAIHSKTARRRQRQQRVSLYTASNMKGVGNAFFSNEARKQGTWRWAPRSLTTLSKRQHMAEDTQAYDISIAQAAWHYNRMWRTCPKSTHSGIDKVHSCWRPCNYWIQDTQALTSRPRILFP